MKNALYLTKVLFLNSFGVNFKKKDTKGLSRVGYIGVLLMLLVFVGAPMVITGYSFGVVFKELDLLKEGINAFIPLMSVMVLLFSIFGIISTFFLSSDVDTLLALPFKPKEILFAKFINSLTSVYLIEIMMLYPVLLGIGFGANMNILYHINSLIITILLPIIPLALFGILLTSLMRYTALNRVKDKMQYIIMGMVIIFAIALEMATSKAGDTTEDLGILIASQNSVLSYVMFFTLPASFSLTTSNTLLSILSMLGYILLSIGAIYLFCAIGEKIYIKGILGKPQLQIKNKKENKIILKEEKKTSLFKELIKNEYRSMSRSPVYNINLIMPVFLMPIILGVSFGASLMSVEEIESFKELLPLIKEFINFKEGSILLFVIATLSFFSSMSMASSCSISREGKNAYFYKIIPVEPIKIINAKVFWGIIFALVPCLLISLVGLLINLMSVIDVVLMIIPLFFYIVLTNYIGILIDLKRPKLDWDNETTAVKQNINTFFYMLADLGITMLIVTLGVILIFIKIPSFIASLILSLLFLLICVIIYRLIKNKGLDIFKNIG